jgi:enamine deaminase RidA (YjgF/YER057c/UK114 family)
MRASPDIKRNIPVRANISSGSSLESTAGFSRAVRIGNLLAVAGTAPLAPDGSVAAPGDVYGQTKRCLQIIATALSAAGLGMSDVIRTRIMLTDIHTWRDAAKAHRELFAKFKPACTFVEVSRFIDPGWLVEVEADGVFLHNATVVEPNPLDRRSFHGVSGADDLRAGEWGQI